MASPLESLYMGMKVGSELRQQKNSSRLADLAAQAYGAAPDQRQGLVQQAIGIDANSGFALGQNLQKTDDARNEQLVQMARVLTGAPDQFKDSIYQRMRPALTQMGMDANALPATYNAQVEQTARALVDAYTPQSQNGVHSAFRGANGNMWVLGKDGQPRDTGAPYDPNMQVFDTGAGVVGINRTQGFAQPITMGAPQQPMAPGEVPFSIDPSLPAPVQAAIRANEPAFAAIPDGAGVQLGPQGQQLRSAPKPSDVPDTFIPLTSDEIAQMGLPAGTVAQRNLKTGKIEFAPQGVQPQSAKPQKPLPATALRLIKDETDAMDAAGTMNLILNRARQRIQSGALHLGMASNLEARARNATGLNDESSRNFQTFVSDLNKARNQSLLLNKGVQTEGDAKRAWDELLSNINDPQLVLQRIGEIEEINARAIRLRQANVDMIRQNYGAEPMDFDARERGPQQQSGGNVIRYDAQGNRIQ